MSSSLCCSTFTFETWVLMSSNFFRAPNYQINFFKDSKWSAVHQTLWTEMSLWEQGDISPPKSQLPWISTPQKAHLGIRAFRPQIISHSWNFRSKISTWAPPVHSHRFPSPLPPWVLTILQTTYLHHPCLKPGFHMVVNMLWRLLPCCCLTLVLYGNHSTTRIQQVHDKDVTIVDLLWTCCRDKKFSTTVYTYGNAFTSRAKQSHNHYNTFTTNLRLIHNKRMTILTTRVGFLQQSHNSSTITVSLQQVHNKMILCGNQA